jgi:hypothetical protein
LRVTGRLPVPFRSAPKPLNGATPAQCDSRPRLSRGLPIERPSSPGPGHAGAQLHHQGDRPDHAPDRRVADPGRPAVLRQTRDAKLVTESSPPGALPPLCGPVCKDPGPWTATRVSAPARSLRRRAKATRTGGSRAPAADAVPTSHCRCWSAFRA